MQTSAATGGDLYVEPDVDCISLPDASWTIFSFQVNQVSTRLLAGEKVVSRVFHTANNWPWRVSVHFEGLGSAKPDYISYVLEMVVDEDNTTSASSQTTPPTRNVKFKLDVLQTNGYWLSDIPASDNAAGCLAEYSFSTTTTPNTGREFGFLRFYPKRFFAERCVNRDFDTATFVASVKCLEPIVLGEEYVYALAKQLAATVPKGYTFMQLDSVLTARWDTIQRRGFAVARADFHRAVFQAFFYSVSPVVSSRWFRDLGAWNNAAADKMPVFLTWLASVHRSYSFDPARCSVCWEPAHRGRCRMEFSRDYALNCTHRVELSARPILCALESVRFGEEDKMDASPQQGGEAVADALRETENAISRTSQCMDELVNLVHHTHAFLPHALAPEKLSAFALRLPLVLERLHRVCESVNLDTFKTESSLIGEEITAMRRVCKQSSDVLEERVRQLKEAERLDAEIARCTEEIAVRTAEKQRAARELGQSKKRLDAAKLECEQRLAALTRQVSETKLAQAKLQTVERELGKLRAQIPPTCWVCVNCNRSSTNASVRGVIHPCQHDICLDCFNEAMETSRMFDLPFLLPTCPAPSCVPAALLISHIHFPDFSFTPPPLATTSVN